LIDPDNYALRQLLPAAGISETTITPWSKLAQNSVHYRPVWAIFKASRGKRKQPWSIAVFYFNVNPVKG
jgi:hypothetical protein